MSEVLVANQDAGFEFDGVPLVIERGKTLARAAHRIVTDYPGLWSPLDVHYDVEEPEPKAPAPAKPAAAAKAAKPQG